VRINPKDEQCHSACEITRLLKSEYRIERSINTIIRWMRKGCRKRGRTIRLESIDIGGQLCSSMEALERFLERLNEEGE
jgi:hypothetical protein